MRRKILALLMVFSMILANIIPVSAMEDVRPLKMSFTSVENFENGRDMEASWEVTNTSKEEVKGYFIAGLYEEDTNQLVSYTYVRDTILGEETKQYGVGISMPDQGEYVLRVFVWGNMDNPKTLSNIIEYPGEDTGERDIHKEVKSAIDKTAQTILEKVPEPGVGSVGGEWAVFGLARAGYDMPASYFDNYYLVAREYVLAEHNKESGRFGNKVTDIQRISLALSAIGKNPEDVDGVDLHDYIWNKADNFPGLPAGHEVLGGRQGSNELIFGLLALDARGEYEEPSHASITRDEIIDKLLKDYQVPSGGFSLEKNKTVMDPDITAMAIQALAPYYNQNKVVAVAVDRAIEALSKAQKENGLFDAGALAGESSDSVETLAQVIVALTAMDIDPHTDERFIKGEVTPITALLDMYYLPNGGFRQTSQSTSYNQMSTEQAMYALVAYDRYLEGENPLYDMRDVEWIVDEDKVSVWPDLEYRPASSEIPDDFDNNLWLNSHFEVLEVGEEFLLSSRRVVEIIDNPINNNVSHPDYTYEVIAGDSITLENTNSNLMTITADTVGTSIIEVGYQSTKADDVTYGAVSAVNKTYIIIDVVEDKDTEITLSTDIDVRSYDTIYFDQGDSINYTFEVATNAEKIEANINGKVIEDIDGNTVTVPLENRANIIGIAAINGDEVRREYHVINAKRIDVIIENNTNPGQPIIVGDEVEVSFKGITMPVYKLATIYNPTWRASMFGETTEGTTVRYNNKQLGEVITDKPGQYTLATKNSIKFTAEEAGEYIFTEGHIDSEWWGEELGRDKDMTGQGDPNLDAVTHRDKFSIMPDFSITVLEEESADQVTLSIEKRIIGKGDTLSSVNVDLFEGDSAWDVMKREMDERSIAYRYNETDWGGVYIESIDGDGEFDHGGGSGWMYTVNGEPPNLGVSNWTLEPDDSVRLIYVTDFMDIYEPMHNILQRYIEDAKTYNEKEYTEESYARLAEAIKDAEAIAANEDYQGHDIGDEKELIMSEYIAALLKAIEGLEEKEVVMLPVEVILPEFPEGELDEELLLEILLAMGYRVA